MSTVVGLKTDKGVWIGADSRASTDEGEVRPIIAEKVFNNGPYLIGFIGSVRGGQLVRPEYFKPPTRIKDWPDALIKHYEAKGCLVTTETQTSAMACNFIIGDTRTGQLFEILVDFQMNEIPEMTAIGSGSNFAFGSLFTTRELNINGKRRVELALEAAETFDAATGPPLYVRILEMEKTKPKERGKI